MNETETRQLAADVLGGIAPEADLASVGDDEDLREALDLDSMDFLNFVVAIHKAFHLEIPETDYPKYMTLNGCLAQLSAARS